MVAKAPRPRHSPRSLATSRRNPSQVSFRCGFAAWCPLPILHPDTDALLACPPARGVDCSRLPLLMGTLSRQRSALEDPLPSTSMEPLPTLLEDGPTWDALWSDAYSSSPAREAIESVSSGISDLASSEEDYWEESLGHSIAQSSFDHNAANRNPLPVLPSVIRHRRLVLDSFDLEGIAKYIKQRPTCKTLVLTGAGISVAAGIPDFRTPGTGLYSRLEEYNLPTPSAIFDLEYFPQFPKPFFTLAKELWPGNYAPTMVHIFITMLHEKGLLLRSYTQNIDGLELIAGMPQDALVEVHGTFATARCLNCQQPHSSEFVKESVFADQIPRCVCSGLIKPDIVFFGEQLPERFFNMVRRDFCQAELVIVIGTSLEVAPFSSLPDKCQEDVPRLLMNNELVGEASPCRPYGFNFSPDNYRDVKFIGDCQQGVLQLAEKMGWKEDLLERHWQARNNEPQNLTMQDSDFLEEPQVSGN